MSPGRGGGATALALAALLAAAPAAAGLERQDPRALAAEAARLLRELAQLRGLPGAGPPPRVVLRGREERRRFVLREFARRYSPERLEAERRALVAWGLAPPDFDLRRFLVDLLLEQAAAYYDPIGHQLVLASWLDAAAQREAIAHELVHLLQDRAVGLEAFLTVPPGRSDEALARRAVVEGDAVALTFDRTLRRQGGDLARLPDVAALQHAIVTSTTGPVLARAPRYLRALLTFPYAGGVGFLHAFRRRYPWSEVGRLYRDPPRSTAQILRPERYFERREDPLAVGLPDLGPLLGPRARRLSEDQMGEFALTAVLQEFLGDEARAPGWRGDRYSLWEDGPGGPVLVARTVWESAAAAVGGAAAVGRLLARKHGLEAPPPPDGSPVGVAGARALALERRGVEVLLVERAPRGVVGALRDAAWGASPDADADFRAPRSARAAAAARPSSPSR